MSRTKKWVAAITAGAAAATIGALTTPWTALADQVILDDLIVDGSACVGQDCVNGESFGFDTIRIKENNLRIKAQDTSSTASFPTQDWQLTFNDSSNGGQNKFSIDAIAPSTGTPFTIEASNQNHALYVDDGGRIGLGTSTPVTEIHSKDGDTPTLRLEQDGTSGFTPQTFDVAANETNFFIRDATNGSTLPFRIRPGAPTSAIDVQADGEVGFGTSNPQGSVHVSDARTDFAPHFVVQNTSSSNTFAGFRFQTSTTSIDFNNTNGEFRLNFDDGDNQELALNADGDMTLDRMLVLEPQATAPAAAADGSVYVDSDAGGTLCFRANGAWVVAAGSGACA